MSEKLLNDLHIGEKNLIKNEWIEDNRPLCVTCKYATWGWDNNPFFNRRFVNGCTLPQDERGVHDGYTVVIESVVSNFNPLVKCDAYRKIEV